MSDACRFIHDLAGNFDRHKFPFEPKRIPESGIYLLFEAGETAHGADRIVQVGTHSGKRRLRSRLREHDSPNKDRSILRKNIGLALLRESNDPFLEKWKLDLTSREARRKHGPLVDFKRQRVIEEAVTDRIRRTFSFVAFPVEDKDARFELKSRIISTLSLCDGCRPSEQWLGRCSPKSKIRESGLWLTQGLYAKNRCQKMKLAICGQWCREQRAATKRRWNIPDYRNPFAKLDDRKISTSPKS